MKVKKITDVDMRRKEGGRLGAYKKALNAWNKSYRAAFPKLLHLFVQGQDQKSIAKICNVSQAYISKITTDPTIQYYRASIKAGIEIEQEEINDYIDEMLAIEEYEYKLIKDKIFILMKSLE